MAILLNLLLNLACHRNHGCARETIKIYASNEVVAAAGLSMEMPPRPPLSMEINTVALKLPALWPDTPRKWFLCCEGKFRLHRITAQQTAMG